MTGETAPAACRERLAPIRLCGGEFQHRSLRGGLAFALLDVETAGTWLLEPRGARAVRVNDAPYAGDLYSLGLSRVPVALVAGAPDRLGGRAFIDFVLSAAGTQILADAGFGPV